MRPGRELTGWPLPRPCRLRVDGPPCASRDPAKPAQIVVAYSNAEWPVKYQPFFEMADAVLPKTGDYVEFKRTVDDLLQQRFALGFYLSRVNDELGEQAASVPKATPKAQKALV